MNRFKNHHRAGLSALLFCFLLFTITACDTPTDPAADAPEPRDPVAAQTGPANESLEPSDDATDAMRKHSASCWETGAAIVETNAFFDRIEASYSSYQPTRLRVFSTSVSPIVVEVDYSASGVMTGSLPTVISLGPVGYGYEYIPQPGLAGYPQSVAFTVSATAVYPDFGAVVGVEVETNTCLNCPGASVCRSLVEGDPYYNGWSSCCDTEEGKSFWVSRYGSSGTYNGDCCYWGIDPL